MSIDIPLMDLEDDVVRRADGKVCGLICDWSKHISFQSVAPRPKKTYNRDGLSTLHCCRTLDHSVGILSG